MVVLWNKATLLVTRDPLKHPPDIFHVSVIIHARAEKAGDMM